MTAKTKSKRANRIKSLMGKITTGKVGWMGVATVKRQHMSRFNVSGSTFIRDLDAATDQLLAERRHERRAKEGAA